MSLITEGADLARPAGADIRVEPSLAGVGDYLALMKPRVMSLVVFTALVGLLVAPGHVHPVIGFTALLCIAIGAGASGALNMWYDADIDAQMRRTDVTSMPPHQIVKRGISQSPDIIPYGSGILDAAIAMQTAIALPAPAADAGADRADHGLHGPLPRRGDR